MKVLVTGVAGFIGSHLAERLARRGDKVIGVDNFNDYYDPARKRRNAEAVEAEPGSVVIGGRYPQPRTSCSSFLKNMQFDAVAHIAAMAGVRNSVANPALYLDVNLGGTQVLDGRQPREFGVQNFVFASTSSIYGDTPNIPFRETDPCLSAAATLRRR